MMRRHRTAIAAGLAALAAVTSLFLLVTSPWPSGSTQGSTTLRADPSCDRDVVVDDDGVFDLKWAAPSLLFGDCTPVLVPRLRTPTPTPTPTPTATPTPPPAPIATEPPPTAVVTPAPAPTPVTYTLQQVLQDANVDLMIDFAVIPGTSGQQAVVITQDGYLWRISLTGAFQRTQFGDVHNFVNCCGEQGLLSLAFSPNYASDRFLYLYYTRANGNQNVCDGLAGQCSFVGRFTVTNNSIGPQPDNIVLRVIEPAPNHNGGELLFGNESPTPYLYLGLGDGGGAGDQYGNGQNTGTILGSIIRIDVSSGEAGYDIPPDNPFAESPGADEIYAWGLRNPWRMSFDRETGQLWVGDVGQGAWEEVDNVTKGGNYGWPCYEGDAAYDLAGCGAIGQYQFPRAAYTNSSPDCAIVGGYVYRGAALPQLRGWYIFSDNCSGRIRGFDTAAGGPPQLLYDSPYAVSSLAELPNGELLVLTFNNAVFQLVAD